MKRFAGWGNVPAMAITSSMCIGGMMLFMPVLSLIFRDLGATDLNISISAAAWTTAAALSQYLGGQLSDRVGRVPVLVTACFGGSAALAAASFATSWIPFLFLYMTFQFNHAVQMPVFSSTIGESVEPRRRGRAFSLVELCIAIAAASTPLIGARMMELTGTQQLLLLASGMWFGAGIIRYRLLRETRPTTTAGATFGFSEVIRGRLLSVTLVAVGCQVALTLTKWGPFMALHANDFMGLTRVQINTYYAVGAVCAVFISPLAGSLVERFGSYITLGMSVLVFGSSFVLWSVQTSIPMVIASYVLIGISFQFCMISLGAFRVAAIDDEVRGRALGALGTLAMLTAALSVPLIGYLETQLGPFTPFIAGLVVAVAVFARLLAMYRSGDEHRHDEITTVGPAETLVGTPPVPAPGPRDTRLPLDGATPPKE